MKSFENQPQGKADAQAQQTLFKEYYPFILSIVEEIQPLLQLEVDNREVLSMASMMLGQLIREKGKVHRRELRKAIEVYLVETYAPDQNREVLLSESAPPALQAENVTGSRVLIVDDSAMARRQISFFLKKDGYEVYEAKSGEEALWLVNEVDPEIILMDVSMDGMDGMETCRRLKEDPDNSTLPIIFLSAKGEREEIVCGFKSGAIDYIVKPFHPAESLTRIRTHLRVKKLAELREKHILELKHLNKTKDRVLRIASHDLRNPVAAIAGLAEFLKADCDNLTEGQKEIVDCIDEAGRSVVLLLNELLDISAIDGGHMELNRESINLCRLVHNLVPLFRGEAERKNLSLSFYCEDDLPEISIDRQQIRRVVDNLVSNALKFTPSGGSVLVKVLAADGGMCLAVEDNGPGIPEAEIDRLFVEFGRTSNVPTGGEKSTGLGLSICQRIVSAHGGSVSFENLPGGGACFRVILPMMAE
jgi:two-component system sensor histidine kinase/response regulator